MEFSKRTGWDRTENRLTRVAAEARARGPVVDLTASNPTSVGLEVDVTALVRELGDARGILYEPEPLGHLDARTAVSRYYATRGLAVDPARVVLAASTSESYSWLFKLAGDAGVAEVLVPAPSYPLLSFLAELEGIELVPFRLVLERGEWRIDWKSVRRAAGPRARAIVLIHPNNPTGNFVAPDDIRQVSAFARERGIALIVDEVFADYAHDENAPFRSFATTGEDGPATFVLSGLSKAALLPQLKLGWMVLAGPSAFVEEARARLEFIADSYLSVATPVQRALPALLDAQPALALAMRNRIRESLAVLDGHVAPFRLPVEAGWYAIVETGVPDDEALVTSLAQEDGVLMFPGYFFDFEEPGKVVVSLVAPPEQVARGASALAKRIASPR